MYILRQNISLKIRISCDHETSICEQIFRKEDICQEIALVTIESLPKLQHEPTKTSDFYSGDNYDNPSKKK